MKVEVTPQKRPADASFGAAGPHDVEAVPNAIYDDVKRLLESLRRRDPAKTLRFNVMRPGVLLPPGAADPGRLPENLTIVITKQGSQPAKVTVSRGDAKWEVTEEQLDKLPDDIRPHVERMLGHYAVGFGRPWTWDLIPEVKPREAPRSPAGRAQPDATLQKQLDQMHRQLEELRKSLDGLKAGQGAEESPPPVIEPPKNTPDNR